MIRTFIKRKVTVIMLTLCILLGGAIAYNNLELAMTPNIDLPVALVSCNYTGAAPEEMEDLITKPMEETLSTLTGVDKIISSSSSGSSITMVKFVDGTDIDVATNDMRDKLDRIKSTLPDDATDPMIIKMDMNAQSIDVAISSDKYDVDTLYNLLDENVTSTFEKIDGVSSVSLSGGTEDEIQITVDQSKMQNYGVTMNSISAALTAENKNIPSGSLKQGSIDISLRTVGEYTTVEDIENTFVTTKNGSNILIKDIADVKRTQKEKTSKSLINGKESCRYSLSKSSDGNIVTVTDNVIKAMNSIQKEYPDFDMVVLTDTADYIKLALNNMVSTAFQAAIIAVLVLLVMLRSVRMSAIIGVSIPTSIFATFGLMYITGMSLNMMSLGGVVIAIGMLVDNSVVVLENIFKKRSEGLSAAEAAYEGTKEVAMAITASTLTTVAVFLPLTFMPGTMGDIIKEISYTVCYALGASLLIALSFVPMASALLMKAEENGGGDGVLSRIFGKIDALVGGFLDAMDTGYAKIIRWALDHRVLTVFIVIALFVSSLVGSSLVSSDLMASTDEGVVSVTAKMPNGSDYDTCAEMMDKIINAIGDVPEQERMDANFGAGRLGSTGTSITINYDVGDKEDRTRSTSEIADDIEAKLQNIAGAEITVSDEGNAMGSMSGKGFTVKLEGDDMDELRTLSDDVIEKLKAIPGAKDIESSIDDASQEAVVTINRAKAVQYGLSTGTIASAISNANSGTTPSEFKTGGSEIDIRIKYPDDDLEYIKDLNNLTITNAQGIAVPLTEVADIQISESALAITRENMQTYVEVTGEISGLAGGEQQKKVQEVLDNYPFDEGYGYSFGGTMEMMNETFQNLFTCIIVAILLVYMVMASQFESFVYPFIIMFSMPMAITGGILGLLITGQSLTSTAYMGLIMLVGMVVNNGIVLVDYTNQLLDNEVEKILVKEALIKAGRSRLRPILMTTLTTVIGMIPVALAIGSGMETNQGMGIVIVFGLTIGTLITLVFIPVLYSLVNGIRRRLRKITVRKKLAARERERENA